MGLLARLVSRNHYLRCMTITYWVESSDQSDSKLEARIPTPSQSVFTQRVERVSEKPVARESHYFSVSAFGSVFRKRSLYFEFSQWSVIAQRAWLFGTIEYLKLLFCCCSLRNRLFSQVSTSEVDHIVKYSFQLCVMRVRRCEGQTAAHILRKSSCAREVVMFLANACLLWWLNQLPSKSLIYSNT